MKDGVDAVIAERLWAEYQALQLSPERRAAAHRRAEQLVEEARRSGVYERALEIAGTVEWSIRWQDLRSEE